MAAGIIISEKALPGESRAGRKVHKIMEIVTAEIIAEWLDQLAEFEAKRDGLAAQKAALLNEVQLPAQIQDIISAGTKRLTDVQSELRPASEKFNAEIDAELSEIVIPEEIRAAYDEIERKRAEVMARKRAKEQALYAEQLQKEQAIRAEIDTQTKAAYEALARRKAEIEAEFSGSLDAVNKNIDDLKAKIKAATINHGATVKGKFYMQVFTKGRTTWITDALDGCYFDMNGVVDALDKYLTESSGSLLDIRATLAKIVKALSSARKVGEPSSALKRIQ